MIDEDLVAVTKAAVVGLPVSRVVARNGGLVIEIATPVATAAIALQGAQVLSWRPTHADRDVLWCPPDAVLGGGTAIRGGVPVCWPWFGPDTSGRGRGQHGFARNRVWRLTGTAAGADGGVTLGFETDGAMDEAFGADVRATLTIEIGETLSLSLETRNTSSRAVPISAAFHPYFAVSDTRAIAVEGLDGAVAVDLDRGGDQVVQAGAITVEAGRTLRFDVAPEVATVVDERAARRIVVTREAGRSAVVWHPGADVAKLADVPDSMAYGFVCVESGDVGASGVMLAPGETHRIAVRYGVHAMG